MHLTSIYAPFYEGNMRNEIIDPAPRSQAAPAVTPTLQDAESILAAHGLAPPEPTDSTDSASLPTLTVESLAQQESLTDTAEEPLTTQQVLLQAGGTVLGNANQVPQLVSSLLRG